MLRRLLCIVLVGLLAPGVAWADPVTVGFILMSSVDILGFAVSTMTLLTVGAGAYVSITARNKARRAQAAARAAYNAGLQDRQVTVLNAAPPQRMILGRCETGGAVVAMFTTDKALSGGGVKRDAYKHLVIVWASHQCQAIHDIKIDGVSIGALDDGNSATGSDWAAPDQAQIQQADASGAVRSITLPGVTAVLAVVLDGNDRGASWGLPQGGANGWSLSGSTLTLPNTVATYDKYEDGTAITVEASSDYTWRVEYQVSAVTAAAGLGNVVSAGSTVRVVHHLGDPNQAVDATLNGLIPSQWTSAHRLRGLCYSVVTLDLERSQFQGGPPGITVDISGALVYDRRSGATAWSDNSALCTDHWLRSAFGYSVAMADVDAASVIAAANACDATASFTTGATTVTGKRYTCNGVISSDGAKEAVLQDLCESMAGWASYGGNWRIMAGTWVPPVMSLGDDDLAGPITIIQAGEPSSEIFNGVRGQYVPAGTSVAADFEPYANATFVAADGRALWTDVDLPFTNDKARSKNLCRIKVEQSRNGLVIHYPAKLKAWPLQTGDRVSINSAEYGFAAKTFRVTDWSFGLGAPVGLTLQEDDAAAYDDADAAVADPTPNTDLPNPWIVPELAGLTLDSGTAQLQKLGDGTIISRVKATWPRSTAAYMDGGRIELSWRTVGSSAWTIVNAAGDDTEAYLAGVADATVIIVSAVVVNANGARSPAVSRAHIVLGKTEPPAAVVFGTPVMQPGRVRIPYTACPDADYATTLLRVGSSWAAGTPLPGEGDATGYNWAWPNLGSYIVWARHVDTTGNAGLPVAIVVSVTSAIYVPGSSVVPDAGWLNSNQQWSDVAGRPKSFLVRASGASASNLPSGWWNGLRREDGSIAGNGPRRSYTLIELDRNGAVVYTNNYDVYGNADPGYPAAPDGTRRNSYNLASDLNYICDYRRGNIIVIYTVDEPRDRRLDSGLPTAMYRCGASRAVFGSSEFKFRSAYLLVGIAGCGEGNGAEAYAGAVNDDPNAWCELSFSIGPNGALSVSGTNSGARSLTDFGYIGALDATSNPVYYQDGEPAGAPEGAIWITSSRAYQRAGGAWRPYVGPGSVGTGELASAAATEVTEFTFAGWSWSNYT